MAGNKTILLKNGQTVALVDEEDYDRLIHMGRWWLSDSGYAICHQGKKKVRMHRVVNNTPPEYITDHINGNKLDNRKANLRTVDYAENNQGRGFEKPKYPTLPKYVAWDGSRNKYIATFKMRKRFDNLEDAVAFTQKGTI